MNANTIRMAGSDRGEVMVYGDLGEMFADGLTALDFVGRLRALGRPRVISVRINSEGGEVSHAIAMFNALRGTRARIEVDVDGVALSSASLVMMAGDVIRAASNAIIMIHDPWAKVAGTAEELESRAAQLRLIKRTVVKMYAARTKRSEPDIEALMSAETWFEAAEAKREGFVDELTGSVRVAAHVDRDRYRKTPADLLPPAKTPHRLAVYRNMVRAMSQ